MQVMHLVFRNAHYRGLSQPSERASAADRRTWCNGKVAFTFAVQRATEKSAFAVQRPGFCIPPAGVLPAGTA